MNHCRRWNNEPYIMYIAWINTITRGGGRHKVQAVVQEVSRVTVWKGGWKPMNHSLYLQLHFPQYRPGTLLPAGKNSQMGQEPACDNCQSSATWIAQRAHPWYLSGAGYLLTAWYHFCLCLPFDRVISSLPFTTVTSHLMDKWQHTTMELVLPHF